MQLRHCVKCDYDLSGVPAEGFMVNCPECAHPNDLSVPFQPRVSTLKIAILCSLPVVLLGMVLRIMHVPLWELTLILTPLTAFTVYRDIVLHRRRARAGKCPSCGYYLGGIEPGSPCPGCKKPAPPIVPDP